MCVCACLNAHDLLPHPSSCPLWDTNQIHRTRESCFSCTTCFSLYMESCTEWINACSKESTLGSAGVTPRKMSIDWYPKDWGPYATLFHLPLAVTSYNCMHFVLCSFTWRYCLIHPDDFEILWTCLWVRVQMGVHTCTHVQALLPFIPIYSCYVWNWELCFSKGMWSSRFNVCPHFCFTAHAYSWHACRYMRKQISYESCCYWQQKDPTPFSWQVLHRVIFGLSRGTTILWCLPWRKPWIAMNPGSLVNSMWVETHRCTGNSCM